MDLDFRSADEKWDSARGAVLGIFDPPAAQLNFRQDKPHHTEVLLQRYPWLWNLATAELVPIKSEYQQAFLQFLGCTQSLWSSLKLFPDPV